MKLTMPAHVVISDIKKNNRIVRVHFAYTMGRFFVKYTGKNAKKVFTLISNKSVLQKLSDNLNTFLSKPLQNVDFEMFDETGSNIFSHRLYCCLDNQILGLNSKSVCEELLSSMNYTVPDGITSIERLNQIIDLERVTPEVSEIICDMDANKLYTESHVNEFISLLSRSAMYSDRGFKSDVYKFTKTFSSKLRLRCFLAMMISFNHYNVCRRITKIVNIISLLLMEGGEEKLITTGKVDMDEQVEILEFN